MKKIIIFAAVLAITVIVSARFSEKIYLYYLKIYYNRMYTEKELVIKSADMLDKKKNAELEAFLKSLIIIYPDNNELKKLAACNYLETGNFVRASEIYAEVTAFSNEDSLILEEMLKKLYYSGHYSDLVSFYDRKILLQNVNTAFYYGVSLFKGGRYDESYKSLIYSKSNTFMLPELSFYIGLNLDRLGKPGESLKFIKGAYESDRYNQTYKKALIDSYRKNGFYKEAEMLLRSRK